MFDMDGVLVESEHLWAEAWEKYAVAHGASWSTDNTRDVQGMSSAEWSAYLHEHVGAPSSPVETENDVVESMVQSVKSGAAPLMDGAAALLRDVSAHVPVGLATSAPPRLIEAVMTMYGLAEYFSGTVSSSEVARGKPSPDVYEEAARRIGVPAVECLAVEDSSNGVCAAARAGMRVVAMPSERYPLRADAREQAFAIVGELHSVQSVLWGQLGLDGGEQK